MIGQIGTALYLISNLIVVVFICSKLAVSGCWYDWFWFPVWHSVFNYEDWKPIKKFLFNLALIVMYLPAILCHIGIMLVMIFIGLIIRLILDVEDKIL